MSDSSPTAGMLTPDDLARFREVQQLAYRCAETVAADLEPGVSEREVAQRMRVSRRARRRRLPAPAVRMVR